MLPLAHNLIYVHGIGPQPDSTTLVRLWNNAIFGQQYPHAVAAHWADIVPYDQAIPPKNRALRLLNKLLPMPKSIPWLRHVESRITAWLTIKAMPQVYAFLFDNKKRLAMEQPLVDALAKTEPPIIIVAHSLGSVIAYNVLTTTSCPQVELLVTCGSPLGIHAIQLAIGELVNPQNVKTWINLADKLDPVAFDHYLVNDVKDADITNISQVGVNKHSPKHPHSIFGYLESAYIRSAIFAELLNLR